MRQSPPARRPPVEFRSGERGWAGPSRGCCWRAWRPSRFGAPASGHRSPGSIRFQVPPTVEFAGPGNFSVSPDGRHLAFAGRGSDGIARLVDPGHGLAGSPAAARFRDPPSSRLLPSGLRTDGSWRSMPAAGSRSWMSRAACRKPCAICRAAASPWAARGIATATSSSGTSAALLRVRESGGVPSPLTALDASRKEEFHLLPTFLPDGRHFVYLRVSPRAPEAGGIYIGTLDAKPEAQSLERLMPYEVGVTYAAATNSGPGRLLFLREGTLIAQPFDERRLALVGEPVPVAERVGAFRDSAFFSVSANDVLVYRSADTDSQLTWFDRQGVVVRPRVGTGRVPRRGAVPGRHSRRRVAHEPAGHDQGRPVAVRSDARKRGHTLDTRRRPRRVPGLVSRRHAHRLHVQQEHSSPKARQRRGRR